LDRPLRSSADVDRVKPLETMESLQYLLDIVRQTRADLPPELPLVGLSGGPFSLASCLIEGTARSELAYTKTLMYGDRGAWTHLMNRLVAAVIAFLAAQLSAGAQCVRLADPLAGQLGYEDYRQYVLPFMRQIIAALPPAVPLIIEAPGNPALLPLLADTNAGVIAVDWRIRLDDAWGMVGFDRSIHGNLDPVALLTDRDEIRRQAGIVLKQAAGRPGHIFDLGAAVLPQTPADYVLGLVDAVRQWGRRV
jgi:uroporphyrinogen decarboxylase